MVLMLVLLTVAVAVTNVTFHVMKKRLEMRLHGQNQG
jgi:hypothetical protein